MKIILFSLILLLGIILRFYALGSNPPSLDWDEASLGYNAYSLLKTGRDEYGISWPLSIKSFNDYKPPLYAYLTIIPVAFYGLNDFSVRVVSAFFGVLTVAIVYFLGKEIFPSRKVKLSLMLMLFLAISPWHLQFSRIAFEANLALFFVVSGVWLWLKAAGRYFFQSLSALSFALSMYAYHSPRLVVPLLILGLLFIDRQKIRRNVRPVIIFFIIIILSILPIARQLKQSTSARFSSVSVINPDEKLKESINAIDYDTERGFSWGKYFHNRRLVYFREIVGGYLDHFNFDFLFLTGDPPGRHHAAGMGMLYFWELPFILLGVMYLIGNFSRFLSWQIISWWFLVAPIASALTSGTPHAVRALFYLPLYQIFTVLGLAKLLKKKLIFLAVPVVVGSFFHYLHLYYVITPFEYAQWWQYGYRQAIETAREVEDRVDRVIFTYRYDQPYIYYLFYNLIDPGEYQKLSANMEIKRAERKIGKYEFRNIDWSQDKYLTHTLFVAVPGELPDGTGQLMGEIKYPDGKTAFRLTVME